MVCMFFPPRHKQNEGLRRNVWTLERRVAEAEQRSVENGTKLRAANEEMSKYRSKLQKISVTSKTKQGEADALRKQLENQEAQSTGLEEQLRCKQRACEEAIQQLDGVQHENLRLQTSLREQIRV